MAWTGSCWSGFDPAGTAEVGALQATADKTSIRKAIEIRRGIFYPLNFFVALAVYLPAVG
jgi:hypothetical protein